MVRSGGGGIGAIRERGGSAQCVGHRMKVTPAQGMWSGVQNGESLVRLAVQPGQSSSRVREPQNVNEIGPLESGVAVGIFSLGVG